MADFELIQAMGIVMGVIITSFIILNTLGPLADEVDYQIYSMDMSNYPQAESTLHTFHDYLFYCILVINFLTVVWFVKLLIAKVTVSKQYQQW